MFKPVSILLSNLFLLLIIGAGCKKEENTHCTFYTNAPVTNVEGPVTGLVNEEINLLLTFECFNGCGRFGSTEDVHTGNLTTVNVKAKYEGCVCTQIVQSFKTTYKFKKVQAGLYELKFWQGENRYYNYAIRIQ